MTPQLYYREAYAQCMLMYVVTHHWGIGISSHGAERDQTGGLGVITVKNCEAATSGTATL